MRPPLPPGQVRRSAGAEPDESDQDKGQVRLLEWSGHSLCDKSSVRSVGVFLAILRLHCAVLSSRKRGSEIQKLNASSRPGPGTFTCISYDNDGHSHSLSINLMHGDGAPDNQCQSHIQNSCRSSVAHWHTWHWHESLALSSGLSIGSNRSKAS